jgi:putative transposase
MPPHTRYVTPGLAQHIIQRGNNRVPLFVSDADFRRFYLYLREACERHGCVIHTYAFMTNHFHLLMTPSDPTGIGRTLQAVGRRYVPYFNRSYARSGALWEGRYRATVIEGEVHVATCYQYIERNPIRAGIVASATEYPWSSYRANAIGDADPLVTPHAWYLSLGNDPASRQAAYRSSFAIEPLDDDILALRAGTQRGWALGSTRFRTDVETRPKQRARPLRAGRSARHVDQPAQTDDGGNRRMRYESDPNCSP